MDFEGINFPVYRKYKNNKSYFKIIHPKLFEQIQVIGSKKNMFEIKAKQFPELMFIHDLVFNDTEIAVEIGEEEYLHLRNGED